MGIIIALESTVAVNLNEIRALGLNSSHCQVYFLENAEFYLTISNIH